jgi:L-threonylcarbamoyladenylate synthase
MVVSIPADGPAKARGELERCIAAGGVAVFPADTLYGLACDPLRAEAIERIHAIKGRDEGKPSAVMYFDHLTMREVLGQLGPRTRAVVAAFLPGPVTLVIPNPTHRYPLASRAEPGRLGVRLIQGPLAGIRTPIFQTSANRSGEPAPSRFKGADPEIVAAVDVAIDGGALTGLPSTVIDVSELDATGKWHVLREGALSAADAERIVATTAAGGSDG